MNTIFATPVRSAVSQENIVGGPNVSKSMTTGSHHHKSLKAGLDGGQGNHKLQDPTMSGRKKLSQLSNNHRLFNTPSAPRTKLGAMSTNTPIGGGAGGLKKAQGKGAHHKEESFVKPSNYGTSKKSARTDRCGIDDAKKTNTTTTTTGASVRAPTLPTVYEEIENMYPMSKKALREEYDPCLTYDLWHTGGVDALELCHSDEDESQKENRLMTVDELCELF